MNTIEWAGLSDCGVVRKNNEDAFSISLLGSNATSERQSEHGSYRGDSAGGVLFIVADGVGGQKAGEVASGVVVTEVPAELARLGTTAAAQASRECGGMLEKAFRTANGQIRQEAAADAERDGMASTVSVLWFLGRRVIMGQVGDSRIYRWRGDQLEQVSHDQSQVGQMLRAGQLSEDEAKFAALRSVVDQALGIRDEELSPEIDWLEVLPGDLFLLSSDGLTDRLKDEQLAGFVRAGCAAGKSLDVMVAELVAAANQAGGRDNVTVILARAVEVSYVSRPTGVVATTSASAPPAASRWTTTVIVGLVACAIGAAAMWFGTRRAPGPEVKEIYPSASPSAPLQAPARDGAAGALASEIQREVGSWRTSSDAGAGGTTDLRVPEVDYTKTVEDLDRLTRMLGQPAPETEAAAP